EYEMDWVLQNRLGVHANAASIGSLQHRRCNARDVGLPDAPLTPPRVPRNVRVQPHCFMRPPAAHEHSMGVLTPGCKPGGYKDARLRSEERRVGNECVCEEYRS